MDGENIWLDPETAYAEVQALADQQGERLPVSKGQLFRRLKEQGLLASWEGGRATAKKTLQGKERRVLHLCVATLSPSGKPGEPGGTGWET